MIPTMKRSLWNVISCGLPFEYDLNVLRKICLLNLIIILGSFFLALLGVIAFVQHQNVLGAVDIVMFLFLIGLFSFLKKTRNHHLVGLIGTITILAFYVFLIMLGGARNTAYMWSFTYPLISLFLLGTGMGTLLSLVLLGLAITVFFTGPKVAFFASYHMDTILRFIPGYLTIFLFAFVMEKSRDIVQEQLRNSKASLEESNHEKEMLIHELEDKIAELKVLRGIVPICVNCKKIRNDRGFWEQVEKYIQERSEAKFSHGLCPECTKKLYGDYLDKQDE